MGASAGPKKSVHIGMAIDSCTVLAAAIFAIWMRFQSGAPSGLRAFWQGALLPDRPIALLLLLGEFILVLIVLSRGIGLYAPMRIPSILREQQMSIQACLTSGLLLTGTLYVVRADEVPRSIVLLTIAVAAVALGARRLLHRLLLYRRFERGMGMRNVLIVGTGPQAQALRRHLESIRHLGYNFKGFIALTGAAARPAGGSGAVLGTLDTLFVHARKLFVDEIFFTAPCDRGLVLQVLEQSRAHGVDLRVVPEMYDGMDWKNPIEYIGQFPTIPLHRGPVPETSLLLKRALDVSFASLLLLALAPLLLAIALAIKLDSPGPVFYRSERLGKKGRVFQCLKFRTMVRDAERRLAEVMPLNERKGVLFKIGNDPRVTRLGRWLRKYSLDELPQFLNVLRGEMSVVGPRPPLASEVRKYQLDHLRRLRVMPGITGLWQVQGRQDPSFDSYVSLDVTYIENWSLWLDLCIVLRTVGVVAAGTGA